MINVYLIAVVCLLFEAKFAQADCADDALQDSPALFSPLNLTGENRSPVQMRNLPIKEDELKKIINRFKTCIKNAPKALMDVEEEVDEGRESKRQSRCEKKFGSFCEKLPKKLATDFLAAYGYQNDDTIPFQVRELKIPELLPRSSKLYDQTQTRKEERTTLDSIQNLNKNRPQSDNPFSKCDLIRSETKVFLIRDFETTKRWAQLRIKTDSMKNSRLFLDDFIINKTLVGTADAINSSLTNLWTAEVRAKSCMRDSKETYPYNLWERIFKNPPGTNMRTNPRIKKGADPHSQLTARFMENRSPTGGGIFRNLIEPYLDSSDDSAELSGSAFMSRLESQVAGKIDKATCSNFPISFLGSILSTLEQIDQNYSTETGKAAKRWKILDPSAGWGDRLASAIALGTQRVQYYAGIDPSSPMKEVYPQIQEKMSALVREASPGIKLPQTGVIQSGSENILLETSEATAVDQFFRFEELEDSKKIVFLGEASRPNLIFTSPPYFDAEKYGAGEETQSYKKYTTSDQWFDQFLWKGIEKQLTILEEGGYLAYNIADPHSKNSKKIDSLIERLNLKLKERDDVSYVGWMPLHFKGLPPIIEPVWVWRKRFSKKPEVAPRGSSPLGYCSQEIFDVKDVDLTKDNMKETPIDIETRRSRRVTPSPAISIRNKSVAPSAQKQSKRKRGRDENSPTTTENVGGLENPIGALRDSTNSSATNQALATAKASLETKDEEAALQELKEMPAIQWNNIPKFEEIVRAVKEMVKDQSSELAVAKGPEDRVEADRMLKSYEKMLEVRQNIFSEEVRDQKLRQKIFEKAKQKALLAPAESRNQAIVKAREARIALEKAAKHFDSVDVEMTKNTIHSEALEYYQTLRGQANKRQRR